MGNRWDLLEQNFKKLQRSRTPPPSATAAGPACFAQHTLPERRLSPPSSPGGRDRYISTPGDPGEMTATPQRRAPASEMPFDAGIGSERRPMDIERRTGDPDRRADDFSRRADDFDRRAADDRFGGSALRALEADVKPPSKMDLLARQGRVVESKMDQLSNQARAGESRLLPNALDRRGGSSLESRPTVNGSTEKLGDRWSLLEDNMKKLRERSKTPTGSPLASPLSSVAGPPGGHSSFARDMTPPRGAGHSGNSIERPFGERQLGGSERSLEGGERPLGAGDRHLGGSERDIDQYLGGGDRLLVNADRHVASAERPLNGSAESMFGRLTTPLAEEQNIGSAGEPSLVERSHSERMLGDRPLGERSTSDRSLGDRSHSSRFLGESSLGDRLPGDRLPGDRLPSAALSRGGEQQPVGLAGERSSGFGMAGERGFASGELTPKSAELSTRVGQIEQHVTRTSDSEGFKVNDELRLVQTQLLELKDGLGRELRAARQQLREFQEGVRGALSDAPGWPAESFRAGQDGLVPAEAAAAAIGMLRHLASQSRSLRDQDAMLRDDVRSESLQFREQSSELSQLRDELAEQRRLVSRLEFENRRLKDETLERREESGVLDSDASRPRAEAPHPGSVGSATPSNKFGVSISDRDERLRAEIASCRVPSPSGRSPSARSPTPTKSASNNDGLARLQDKLVRQREEASREQSERQRVNVEDDGLRLSESRSKGDDRLSSMRSGTLSRNASGGAPDHFSRHQDGSSIDQLALMRRHQDDAAFEDERSKAEAGSGLRLEPLASTRNLSDSFGFQNDNRKADLAAGRDCSSRAAVEKSPWDELDRLQGKSDLVLERERSKPELMASSSGFQESFPDRDDRLRGEAATGDSLALSGGTSGRFGDHTRFQDEFASMRGGGLGSDERALRPAEALVAESRGGGGALMEHEKRGGDFEQPVSGRGDFSSVITRERSDIEIRMPSARGSGGLGSPPDDLSRHLARHGEELVRREDELARMEVRPPSPLPPREDVLVDQPHPVAESSVVGLVSSRSASSCGGLGGGIGGRSPGGDKGSSNSALQKLLKMCDSPADGVPAAQPMSSLETALRGGPTWNAPGRR